jgi:hypothetical protein
LCLIELCFELLKILPCEELMWDVCFWYLVWIVFAKEDLKQWTMPLGVYIFVYATLVDGQFTTMDFLMISLY